MTKKEAIQQFRRWKVALIDHEETLKSLGANSRCTLDCPHGTATQVYADLEAAIGDEALDHRYRLLHQEADQFYPDNRL